MDWSTALWLAVVGVLVGALTRPRYPAPWPLALAAGASASVLAGVLLDADGFWGYAAAALAALAGAALVSLAARRLPWGSGARR